MERLTQWTPNGASLVLNSPKNDAEAREMLMQQFRKACNRLAELEDALEGGKLVEAKFQPKYDENETVYIIDRVNEKYWSVPNGRYVVRKCFVVMVSKYMGYRYRIQPYDLPKEILDDSTINNEYWERTFRERNKFSVLDVLYPTQEEAESRLKELQGK